MYCIHCLLPSITINTYHNMLFYLVTLLIVNSLKLCSSFQWSEVKSLYPTSTSIDNAQNLNYVSWNTLNSELYDSKETIDDLLEKTELLSQSSQDGYFMPHMKYAINRIFGGNEAQPNTFSYQAGILLQRPRGLYWCGGSLITSQFILTAAHCVDMCVCLEYFSLSDNKFISMI